MFIMTVTCTPRDFDAYWYGHGQAISLGTGPDGRVIYEVNYGEDEYRAEYQAGRFWSGLMPAKVEQIRNPNDESSYSEEA